MLNISQCAPWTLWLIFFLGCSPAVYLENHKPTDLIFQKKTYGGIAAMTGTELNAPTFSLYADGRVICYHYEDGKRKLISGRMTKSDFKKWYTRISNHLSMTLSDSLLKLERSVNPSLTVAPTTEFYFETKTTRIDGLGLYQNTPAIDSLQNLNRGLDAIAFENFQPYTAEKIVLYVKCLKEGDPHAWPEWIVPKINLDLLYNREVNFYEPNVAENSVMLEGETALAVQKVIEQVSIYQKFSYSNKIYAVGYRPELPQ